MSDVFICCRSNQMWSGTQNILRSISISEKERKKDGIFILYLVHVGNEFLELPHPLTDLRSSHLIHEQG